MMANSVPFLTPIFLMSLIWATRAGNKDTIEPEPNPYSTAKTMTGAFDLLGSHSANTMTAEK